MNRLIILGNGFDLAHGLDTRYNDFILWYLKKCFNEAYQKGIYEDDLSKIEKTIYANHIPGKESPIDNYIEDLYKKKSLYTLFDLSDDNLFYIVGYSSRDRQPKRAPFLGHLKFDFPKTLLSKCNLENWVEIENEYYETLKGILNKQQPAEDKGKQLNNLNKAFYFITKQLEEYLQTILPTQLNSAFSSIFEGPISKNEIISSNLGEGEAPNDTLVLNFNYTTTVEHYFKHNGYGSRPKVFSVNYIHGKLGDKKNPIIFGFGDELDADYAKMEQEKIHGYFDHIKSFGYFKTSNYHNLIRFLDADEYQVFILGHSCGLSDRTMLNMIFEHDNCKSIKIYYYEDEHGVNNFTPLTEEISRHFKNKAIMRRKIVPFDKSSPMPQIK